MSLRDRLLRTPIFREMWAKYRTGQLHRSFAARADRYRLAAQERGLLYSPEASRSLVRERLAARGYSTTSREPGDVHTFAFVPSLSWHEELIPDLRELGPVSRYDYETDGYSWHDLVSKSADAPGRRRAVGERFVSALQRAHAERPVDWVFVYASGGEVDRSALLRAQETLGVPIVNMCLDDKQSWDGFRSGDQRTGQIDIASAFDLVWTSASVACEWYLVEGGIPVYLPEGFDATTYRPTGAPKDLSVSFVGGSYGYRSAVIRHLERAGVDVTTRGFGWPGGPASLAEQVDIFNRSRINLGMGGIGYSETLTNVKARDFAIPGTGGGMYLTTYNSDLASHFEIGKEIDCYRSREDLIDRVHHYLKVPDECEAMVSRARERCLQEHRWLHRYLAVLEMLGVIRGRTAC